MHLVGFVIRICHDVRSPERQIYYTLFMNLQTSFSPFKDPNKPDLYLNILLVPHRQQTPSALYRPIRYRCVANQSLFVMRSVQITDINSRDRTWRFCNFQTAYTQIEGYIYFGAFMCQ